MLDRQQLIQDTYETLRHWHYPIPGQYTNGDETITFGVASWSIESTFVTITDSDIIPAPVAIISYAYRTYGERYFEYISYRNTDRVVLLDKHSIVIQRLFTQARTLVQTTMQSPKGGYQVYDDHVFVLTDQILLPVIADMLSKQEIELEQEN